MLFKDIIGNNVVIHCATQEKSNEFLKECISRGAILGQENTIKDFSWDIFKLGTCYYIDSDMRISCGSFAYFLDAGYEVIDFEEFQKSILLEKLNQFACRNFTEEEVYIFPITLCDNIVDCDNERFSVKALEEMRPMFLGVTGIIDDHRKCIAKIFYTEITTEDRGLLQMKII